MQLTHILDWPAFDILSTCIYSYHMQRLIISAAILEKLRDKHKVSRRDIEQCFENRLGNYLLDEREDHRTDPPTLWFIASTNCNRPLKIAFIFIDGNIHIKSAFDPEIAAIEMYDRMGR